MLRGNFRLHQFKSLYNQMKSKSTCQLSFDKAKVKAFKNDFSDVLDSIKKVINLSPEQSDAIARDIQSLIKEAGPKLKELSVTIKHLDRSSDQQSVKIGAWTSEGKVGHDIKFSPSSLLETIGRKPNKLALIIQTGHESTVEDIGKQLGKGAFGTVVDTPSGKALKILDPDIIKEELADELRGIGILSDLNHKNIISVSSDSESKSGGSTILQLDLFESRELGKIKRDETFIPNKDCMIQLRDGFFHMLDKGVINNDIKSANLLINNENKIKYCDFGFAITRDEFFSMPSENIEFYVNCGTPIYNMQSNIMEKQLLFDAIKEAKDGNIIAENKQKMWLSMQKSDAMSVVLTMLELTVRTSSILLDSFEGNGVSLDRLRGEIGFYDRLGVMELDRFENALIAIDGAESVDDIKEVLNRLLRTFN
ncbi:hypothetical protein DID75_03100 [Candidatus Marinamargulisbacteria bacterium SCGC AG-410-N11]|nr:hypothetical protein DID75_03100 [Candidatus Marinamargulisbacteria bacterium SCGC AG-410-N11]